ncbi:hypothetical protein [Chryseobacterium oryctis]|uniref:Uncharacterized protein n=1 Tax=Chryseobacterium oryctis TaxID=2952618 RepID=A0ABT3HJI9_9FLAO|nr:hypothetical protein [Chryseobacterium oryctis]MCW3159853.1 hypothetical protein [Chryseobacterium oryctis]
MKSSVLLILLSCMSFVQGQQVEGLKVEKENKISTIERKINSKQSDSLAKSNLNSILKENHNKPNFGYTNQYGSDTQKNLNNLKNNMNTFNNNLLNDTYKDDFKSNNLFKNNPYNPNTNELYRRMAPPGWKEHSK